MCLAAPMQLINIDGETGTARMNAVRQAVDLSLIESPAMGDYVIVHAGFAIEKLDRKRARQMFRALNTLIERRARHEKA